jgi:hypothetical protein
MTITNEQEHGPKICQPERQPSVEAEIECRLKAYYANILSRPIPDRLLRALKAAQEQSSVAKAHRRMQGDVLHGSIQAPSPLRAFRDAA